MPPPLDWMKRLLDTIPELKKAPLLDWEKLAHSLSARLQIPNLRLHTKNQQMQEGALIYKGIGTDFTTLQIALSQIGTIYWIMSKQDISRLTLALMRPFSKSRAPLSDILQEGFYRYLALESLDAIQNLDPFQTLTLQLTEEESVVDQAFCTDVTIDIDEKTFFGRVVIPKEVSEALATHFRDRPFQYISHELAHSFFLCLTIKVGSLFLSQEEIGKIKAGDFIVLDKNGFDPQKGTGASLVLFENTPLFNAKIKHNKIEISDYAPYYEEPIEGQNAIGVELGRIKMSLDALMHLTPGKSLDLPIDASAPVSLTFDGQIIGRGELLYLGHQLGIRMLLNG